MALRHDIGSRLRLALAVLLFAMVVSSLCLAMTATVAMASDSPSGCGGSHETIPDVRCCGYETQQAQQADTHVTIQAEPLAVSLATEAPSSGLGAVSMAPPSPPPSPRPLRL